MRHDEEDTGVNGLKKLNPGSSNHDGIHINVDQVMGQIPYELVTLLPVMSNHVISAFQRGYQAFPLVKVKTTNDNT
jgi:hypothetical protein